MFYKKQLEIAKKNNINIIGLDIANEVESIFENLLDDDFEKSCALVERAYLKSEDLSINQIVRALQKLQEVDCIKFENITKEQLINEACYM